MDLANPVELQFELSDPRYNPIIVCHNVDQCNTLPLQDVYLRGFPLC